MGAGLGDGAGRVLSVVLAVCATMLLTAAGAGAVVGGRSVSATANPAVFKLTGCTASLISSTRFLTAAHCSTSLTPHGTSVRIAGQLYRVQRVARDPRYRYVQHQYTDTTPYAPPYDAAIGELDRPVTGTAPLALDTVSLRPGRAARIIGFGITSNHGTGFGTLRAAQAVGRALRRRLPARPQTGERPAVQAVHARGDALRAGP